MRFDKHLSEEQQSIDDALQLLELMIIIDECKMIDVMDEGAITDTTKAWYNKIVGIFSKKIDPVAKKAGLHVDTKKKGLLQYLTSASKGTAQLLYHSVNAYYNKNKASEIKVKELAQSVRKEDVLDVLLKLDTLTMHWVSGPIHILDALTGWHLWANIQDKASKFEDKAHNAIASLEDLKDNLEGKFKTQLQNYANGLRRIFNIGQFGKMTENTNEVTITPDIAEPDMKIGSGAMNRRLKKKKGKGKRDGSCQLKQEGDSIEGG